MEAARFFAVALAGLMLDLALAWVASRVFGLPLWMAALLGLVTAAGANYIAHELWTFQNASRKLSIKRAFRYGLGLTATVGTRVGTVAILAILFGEEHALAVLVAGACVSYLVNFLISKYFVFRKIPDE
ncbi:Putative flippase GtrA (transmembrane translocase of bactoprenol-linked glucose) [Sulfitobacter marinus]|uniref:Putative flippase GtrA (Transmembrane translocase of bactoprenol-linked glucose) n=1 Tax=Sulfitobacter marinus TaxID=394264 RepID=A0A1I6VDQ2_9RHOB|nr:GtrA family protein [Sulfitobacter marinus]SFT11664.1 Putative flippase GtrA (transmembrane translocase of bactoprenol-linked glucose) [Sulfitobacter marinus]